MAMVWCLQFRAYGLGKGRKIRVYAVVRVYNLRSLVSDCFRTLWFFRVYGLGLRFRVCMRHDSERGCSLQSFRV